VLERDRRGLAFPADRSARKPGEALRRLGGNLGGDLHRAESARVSFAGRRISRHAVARVKRERTGMGRKRLATGGSDAAAGNGILDRRSFLGAAASLASIGALVARPATAAGELSVAPWMKEPGSPFVGYGQPSKFEAKVVRTFSSAPGTTGTGASRTPLQHLNGTITPNGLHFERHHSGIPDIDPDAHRLLIHGLVKRPLVFTPEALARYPMETRIAFIECGGNSGALYQKEPAPLDLQALHGLVSCAEWTGVRLAVLLEEAGVGPEAQWLLAEGADAAGMSRSIPIAKAMDDAMVALHQNGERVRPSNGYPLRLLLPGYEGNMNVKWLRRIKVTKSPTMTKDETSKYTILLPSGKALQFVFPIEAKSVITHPSPGMNLKGPSLYEISGLAWSGYGKITQVDVSADGGKSWAAAALQEPVLPKALTGFRIPWQWSGGPAVLQSRASDSSGYVQPSRDALIAERGTKTIYHFNGVTSWAVGEHGEVRHVYA
jgi:sulfane dehydrogenase subunit SoxC